MSGPSRRKRHRPRRYKDDGSFEDLHPRDKALIRYSAWQDFYADVFTVVVVLVFLGIVFGIARYNKVW